VSSPRCAQAHNRLGVLYFQNGENQQARKEFEAAIEISPDFASPYFNLGILDEDRGEEDRALQYFQKAVSVEEGFTPAYKHLGMIYGFQKNEVRKGVKYLERYLKMIENPDEKFFVQKQIYNLKHGIRSLE